MSGPKTPRIYRLLALVTIAIFIISPVAAMPLIPSAPERSSELVVPEAALPIGTGSRDTDDLAASGLGGGLLDTDNPAGNGLPANALPLGNYTFAVNVTNTGTDPQNSFSVNNTIGYSASAIKVFNDSADGTGLGTWSKVNFTAARKFWVLNNQNHAGSAGVNSFTAVYTSGPDIGKYGTWWEQVLEMKNCVNIPANPGPIEPHLTYWQMYTTQGSKDGGYAQMQIGSGAWMTITPENPVPPPQLAYPGSVNTAMSNGGGFSGTHTPYDGSGWNYTWFPLWSNQVGQVNGTCIKFRWWFASDGASNNNGWLIDDIRVQYGNGTADALVAGFTPIVGNAGDLSLFNIMNMNSPDDNWTKVATQDHTGGSSGSFWTGDVFLNRYVPGEDSALISPTLDLTGAELARLSYWQRYNLSAGDGAWVEASTNGVTYNTIEPLFELGTVTTDGTNYPSSIDIGSEYGGIPAFSGNKDWTRVVFDLTPYVGNANARVRFHLYANSDNQNDKGWYIDDVLVNKWHFTSPVTPYVNISVTTSLASGTKGTFSTATKYVFDTEGYWMIKENAKLVGDTNASNNLYNGLIYIKDIREVAVAPGATGGVFLVNHGYPVSFDLVVMNKGNLDDTFNITATSVPVGWNVSYIGETSIDVSAFLTATVKSTILTNISSTIGDYKVNFSAKSKANASISTFYEVKITVTNKIPTGIILSTTTQVAVYQKVTFTAKDPDDQLDDSKGWEVYMWDFGDGQPQVNTSLRTTEYMYKKPTTGTPFVVTLKVFDGLNISAVTTQSKLNMTVTNANPNVNFTIEGMVVSKTYAINKNLTFKPRVSDENVTTCSYQWDFKDGTTMTNKTDVIHSFQNGGKYTVTLTVSDDSGAAGSYTEQVVINTPPEAKITAPSASHNGTSFQLGDSIYFSAVGSSDADGDALTYVWESNLAGILYEGPNVDFNYIFDSNIYVHTHQITLTVKDNKAMPDIAPATVMAMVSLNIIAADQHLPELIPAAGMVEAHEPLNGTVKPDTEFTFKIIYKDVDGDPAYAVYLVIEDSTQPTPRNISMNIAGDTPSEDDIVAGILYTITVKASEIPNSAGVIHNYKFTAADKRDLLNFSISKTFGNLRITKDKYFGNPKDDSVTATVTFVGSDTDVPLKMEELVDPVITAPQIDNAPADPVGLFAKVSVNTSFPAANWDKAVLQITWGKPKFKANVDNLTEAQIYLYELKGGQWVRVGSAIKDADSWKLDMLRGDLPAEGKTYALYGKPKEVDINRTDDGNTASSNIEIIAIVALLAMVAAVIGLVVLTRQRKKAEKDWKGQDGIDLDIDITTGKGVTGEVTTEGDVEKMTEEQIQAESIGDTVKVFRPGGGSGELPGQVKEEEPAATEEGAGEVVQEAAGGEGGADTPPEPTSTETEGASPPADEPPKEG